MENITLSDLFKHEKTVIFYWLIQGRSDCPLKSIDELSFFKLSYFLGKCSNSAAKDLAKWFKPILPKITKNKMGILQKQYKQILFERAKSHSQTGRLHPNQIRFERAKSHSQTGRLHPLTAQQYDDYARTVWKKRGCPKFGKKIASGAIWGKPELVTNGKSGMKKVIYSRYFGVDISGNKLEICSPD